MATRPRPCFECVCGDHVWTRANRGFVVLVSPEDSLLLRGRAWTAVVRQRSVYAQANVDNKRVYLHRQIIAGAPETDHINHCGVDNRRSNLRATTRTENSRNTRPHRTPNRTSQFKGVHWNEKDRRWAAQLDGSHIGHFLSEQEAALAYDATATLKHGEFAFLNFGRRA